MLLKIHIGLAIVFMLASTPAISAVEDNYVNAYAVYFGIPLSDVVQQKNESIKLSQSFRRVADLKPKRVKQFVEENPTGSESLVEYIHSLPSQYITEENKRNLIFQIISTLASLEVGNKSDDLSKTTTYNNAVNRARGASRASQLPESSQAGKVPSNLVEEERLTTASKVEEERLTTASKNQESLNSIRSHQQYWRVGGGFKSTEPVFSNSSRTTRTVNGVVLENTPTLETSDSNSMQGFVDLSYSLPKTPIRIGGKLLLPTTLEHTLANNTFEHFRPWVVAPYVELNSPIYFGQVQPFVSYSAYSYDVTLRTPVVDGAFFPLAYEQDVEKISIGADYHLRDAWLVRLIAEFVSSEYNFGNVLSGKDESTELGFGLYRSF